jgi:hypothetical protein
MITSRMGANQMGSVRPRRGELFNALTPPG